MEGPCRKVPARRCGRARSTRDLEPVFGTSPDDGKLSSDRLGRVSSPAVLVVVVFDKTDVLVIGDFRGSESSLGISARFQPRQSLYFSQTHVAFGFIGGCGSGFPVVDCNFFFGFFGFMPSSIERGCSIHWPTHARPFAHRSTMRPFIRRSTLAIVLICFLVAPRCVLAKPRPRVPEKLDDVVDDEEDDEYKSWGMTKRQLAMEREMEGGGPPGGGGGGFDLSELTKGGKGGGFDALAAASSGPQMTFVKLNPPPDGSTRTQKQVDELSGKWATLLRSGGMSENLYAIDVDTVLINMADGKYMPEVREFLWEQDEVESFEWNSRVWKKGESKPTPRKQTEDAKFGKNGKGKKKRKARKKRAKKAAKDGEL